MVITICILQAIATAHHVGKRTKKNGRKKCGRNTVAGDFGARVLLSRS
jgi:hypothetical protein